MDSCPLGLGLVVGDKPTEFSCSTFIHMYIHGTGFNCKNANFQVFP